MILILFYRNQVTSLGVRVTLRYSIQSSTSRKQISSFCCFFSSQDKVLHNIMPIFTFMGANVLRLDDTYTFQVINKTVQMVIPALIQVNLSANTGKDLEKVKPMSFLSSAEFTRENLCLVICFN